MRRPAAFGHKLLEPGILIYKLLQLADLLRLEPTIQLLPTVKRLLGNPDLADQVRHRQTHLRLLQDRDDLLGRITLLPHGQSPHRSWENPPKN